MCNQSRDISSANRPRAVEQSLRRTGRARAGRTEESRASNDTLKAEIAERLRAEEARRELLRRLVTAQEDERRRISASCTTSGARLTALMIGLKTLDEDSYGRQPALASLRQLQR